MSRPHTGNRYADHTREKICRPQSENWYADHRVRTDIQTTHWEQIYRPHTWNRCTLYRPLTGTDCTDHTLGIDIQTTHGNRYTDHSLGTDKKRPSTVGHINTESTLARKYRQHLEQQLYKSHTARNRSWHHYKQSSHWEQIKRPNTWRQMCQIKHYSLVQTPHIEKKLCVIPDHTPRIQYMYSLLYRSTLGTVSHGRSLIHTTRVSMSGVAALNGACTAYTVTSMRRKIRPIEGNAKCRHRKKLT